MLLAEMFQMETIADEFGIFDDNGLQHMYPLEAMPLAPRLSVLMEDDRTPLGVKHLCFPKQMQTVLSHELAYEKAYAKEEVEHIQSVAPREALWIGAIEAVDTDGRHHDWSTCGHELMRSLCVIPDYFSAGATVAMAVEMIPYQLNAMTVLCDPDFILS